MVDRAGDAPATITYAELVDEHLARLFQYVVLLVGDGDVAEAETLAAFRRIWSELDAGNVFGDAEDILYWTATRGALRRLGRSRELRGHLPPTTADDRLITATGIIGDFGPQQRAAIFLAVWGGVGYELAGRATGVGTARARDLAFAARQEYRTERRGLADATPTCAEIAPLLSARADGAASPGDEARITAHLASCAACTQTAALYDEFASLIKGMRLPVVSETLAEEVRGEPHARRHRRPVGWRRLLRLAIGPAILTVVLIIGLFILQGFGGEPSIKTGAGRTSDVVYGLEAGGGGLIIVDAGSGRRLGRLPAGALTAEGRLVYSSSSACGATACTTTLSATDTGTLETNSVGRVEGKLTVVAVDEGAGRLYLTDEAANWGRLLVYDLAARQVGDTLTAPAGVEGAFTPAQAEISPDHGSLFTVGTVWATSNMIPIVGTDLRALRVVGTAGVPSPADGGLDLLPAGDTGRVYVYETGNGRLVEVDTAAGHVGRALDLSGLSAPTSAPPGGSNPQGTAAMGPDGLLYAAVRTGGIAVVDLGRFEVLRRLNADRDYNTVSVSTDGRMLYVVDSAGAYVALDAATGNQLLRRSEAPAASLLQVNQGE